MNLKTRGTTTMKIISDIRLYKSSETENHIGFASKSLNIAVRRLVMKLREQGFSLGTFDHLYLNFTVLRPEGTIELIDEIDRYHPWYRYCDIGVSQCEYDKLGAGECIDYIYAKIEAVFLKLFDFGDLTAEIVQRSIAEAKKGAKMLMRFKEKKSAKSIATIYLRLLENGRYCPLLCVNDLDGKEILCTDLPETIDLSSIGEIQLSSKKVTVKPRKNAFTKDMEPISFNIQL